MIKILAVLTFIVLALNIFNLFNNLKEKDEQKEIQSLKLIKLSLTKTQFYIGILIAIMVGLLPHFLFYGVTISLFNIPFTKWLAIVIIVAWIYKLFDYTYWLINEKYFSLKLNKLLKIFVPINTGYIVSFIYYYFVKGV